MASVVNSSLPVVTTIRLDLGPDQTIRTRDFLRGLKRPAQRSVLIPAGREIILHTLDHHDELMEAPKIVQTQAKNTKRTSAQADGLGDPSPLFCSQGPSEKDDQYTQCLQEEANKLISRPTVTYACSTKSRNGIPATMRGNQRLTTELAEQQLQPTSASELESPPKQKKRKAKKKKKRRVPVNELVLVPTLSLDPDSRRAIKVSETHREQLVLWEDHSLIQ